MRVAHLLPNMVTGGRERIVADLVARAPALGITPVVVAYDPAAEGRRLPVDARVVPLDRAAPSFVERLDRWCAAERVDVLHAHGHVAAALAAGVSVPNVTTLHVALGAGWRWLPAIVRGLRRSAAIAAVSDDLARRFRPLAGQPIATILPGVVPGPARIGGGAAFTIGIAARLHPVKRHGDLLAAMRLLGARGAACRLRVAGQGSEEAALRRAAAGLDVVFDGDLADMGTWLSRLDAFVLVSDHEGTPLALIEAMAAGLPCVATRVGGVPAAVGDAALLVPKRRPGRIADALEQFAADPVERARLGEMARGRARMFDPAAAAAAYAALYARALGRGRST